MRSSTQPLNVDYATTADTASDLNSDYTAAVGTLTFVPNFNAPQTRTVSVLVTGDQKVELDEAFFVDLTNIVVGGRDVTFADSRGAGGINNDDSGHAQH